MYDPQQDCYIWVTIEAKNDDITPKIERWRGSSVKAIRTAVKKKYAGKSVQFGRSVWISR